MQAVVIPTDVNATGRVAPTVSGGPSILGNQQLADMEIGITERDSRIALNEHQLAATQQRHRVALVSPDSVNSSSQILDRQHVFEDRSAVPSTAVQYPNPAIVHCCPRITLKILQTLCKWLLSHVVEATSRVTPKVSDSQPSNVAAQNADASLPQSLHHPGVSPVPVVAIPQLAELVPVSSLPITTNVMVPSALAASGSNPSESVLVQQLQAEVLRLSSALQLQQQQLQQMQQQQQFVANPQLEEVASVRSNLPANLPTATNAVVPCAHAASGSNPTLAKAHQAIASACAPPASIAKGAALGAPQGINRSQASLAGTPYVIIRPVEPQEASYSRGRCFLRSCRHCRCPLSNKVFNTQRHHTITTKVHVGLLTLQVQGHHPTVPPWHL